MRNLQPLDERPGRHVETTVGGEVVRAFVPPPLPPIPPIDALTLLPKLSAAERAPGRLDGMTVLLPHQELFLHVYVRKEAVLSAQIEGTQSTLSDLLRLETGARAGEPVDDIREVSNHVDAMMYGLERLGDLPLVTSPDSGIAWTTVAQRAWRHEESRRIPSVAEPGRRHAPRQRDLRPSARK